MKKKFKDLTVKEIANICKKHKVCDNCPLNKLTCMTVYEEDLDQEIEVE